MLGQRDAPQMGQCLRRLRQNGSAALVAFICMGADSFARASGNSARILQGPVLVSFVERVH